MREFLTIAMRTDVRSRATKVALLVGTILVVINQGDVILAGTLTAMHWLKIALTYCVPYCVSTYSAVGAEREYSGLNQE